MGKLLGRLLGRSLAGLAIMVLADARSGTLRHPRVGGIERIDSLDFDADLTQKILSIAAEGGDRIHSIAGYPLAAIFQS
ncbi:MAG: hypothetical protein ACKOA0_16090, partial [Burkholderiaceae bacterium]